MAEGERQDATFMLPVRLRPLSVSGAVLLPDGTPAPGVNVVLASDGPVISRARTNASGAFALTGLSWSTFSARASFFVEQRQIASAEITLSLAEEPVSDVKLVLKQR